ncbi:MAG TPA: DUF3618 domain-containing protein [Gaiellaceae bacterium]|nr:DUF3618 domain-containing protein [Gaiellaceae bacterium]
MPADKSPEQLREELAAERARLGSAVHELREQIDRLRRKLPFVAAGAAAVGLLAGLLRRRRG